MGKFAFTTEENNLVKVNLENKHLAEARRAPDQLLFLNMKHRVEAKICEEIAKMEKVKPLVVELCNLEDLPEPISNDSSYMKKR
ncbi:unnamed protein product [Ranitomeya imitator]|uniref:Uncharacterized protein n=1 Tax=Ranitomeya imitator TaxID=111125 RepID=A0ABN9L0F9_9NEOB|nr:unnamed protein product [Ranitomeya imitator]